MSNNSPIGVFDSGVGGLTVVREITRQLPNESIIYFGDTARVPYGNKSQETVTTYSRQIVHFLMKNNVVGFNAHPTDYYQFNKDTYIQ